MNRARLGYLSFLIALDFMPIPFIPAIGTMTVAIAVLGKKAAVFLLCFGLVFEGVGQVASMAVGGQNTIANIQHSLMPLNVCSQITDNATKLKCALAAINGTFIGRLVGNINSTGKRAKPWIPMPPGLPLWLVPLAVIPLYIIAAFVVFRRYNNIVKTIRKRIRPLFAWKLMNR